MSAANELTAEFGGYQRSVKSLEQGAFAVKDSIKVFISYADQNKK
jgi:hypothetical protein